ncbi:MAG TPA: hypothetical protein PLV32_02120, partial [Chitinophagaceae bacterium]|nr:hypothetical protein [Chitinophagaceae bacterium]
MPFNSSESDDTKDEAILGSDENDPHGISRKKPVFSISEDIWAVLIGGFLITIVLLTAFTSPGLKFRVPVYKWSSTAELNEKVFALSNLMLITSIGIVFALLCSIAIRLSGGSVKKFMTGFALVYVLGIAALIISGNHTINYYGIEYVVFALVFGLLISNLGIIPNWLREAA